MISRITIILSRIIIGVVNKEEGDILKDLREDRTDFFMALANIHLNQIPNSIPLSDDGQYLLTELQIQSFVIFSVMVIERLESFIIEKFKMIPTVSDNVHVYGFGKQEQGIKFNMELLAKLNQHASNTNIEKKQSIDYDEFFMMAESSWHKILYTKSKRPHIYDIMKKLHCNDPQQKEICNLIIKYFSKPLKDKSFVIPAWDFSKSKLRMLKEIRNHVAHHNIINRHYYVGSDAANTVLLRFDMYDQNKSKIVVSVENPYEFCYKLFVSLSEFREKVFDVINPPFVSNHYKDLPAVSKALDLIHRGHH